MRTDASVIRSFDLLDAQLRDRLRGCSLVCEARLPVELVAQVSGIFQQIWAEGLPLRRFPAITAMYLSDAARERYRGGALWPELLLHPSPAEAQQLQQRLGEGFTKAIEGLSLAHLDALLKEGASRYVSFIVAHSGIPDYCVADFISLVADELGRGKTGAADMIASWRQAPTARFKATDRPVQRFLLYGGAVAEDLVDRCLDLILAASTDEILPDAVAAGVSERMLEVIRSSSEGFPKGTSERGRIVTPIVRMRSWDNLGPRVCLPQAICTPGTGPCRWEVESDSGVVHASAEMAHEIPLPPSVAWTVRLRDPDGRLLRTWYFPGPARGLLVFDENSGVMLPPTAPDDTIITDHDRVVLVQDSVADSSESSDGVRVVEELGALDGVWQGFRARVLVLNDSGARLTVGGVSLAFVLRRPVVSLASLPVEHIQSVSGKEVYASLPVVRVRPDLGGVVAAMEVRIDNAQPILIGRDELVRHDTNLFTHPELAFLRGRETPFSVRLTFRGALGTDQRESFLVVPGLCVKRPVRPPSTGEEGEVSIATATNAPRIVKYPEYATSVRLKVCQGERTAIELVVRVPATVWRISGSSEELDARREVVLLHEDDLKSDQPRRLWVRTGIPGQVVSVRLRDGDRVGPSQEGYTSGPEGEWSIDLKQWTDDVVRSSTRAVIVEYVSGFELMEVARIATDNPHELLGIKVQEEPGIAILKVAAREHRRISRRLLRLWRVSQPWRQHIDHQIPDTADIDGYEIAVSSEQEAPPGHYIAQLLVNDGWNPLPRQPQRQHGVTVRIGDNRAARDWVNSASIRSSLTSLERAWRFGEVIPSGEDPSRWLAEALQALAAQPYLPIHEHHAEAVGRLVGPHHPEFAALATQYLSSLSPPERLGVCLPFLGPVAANLLNPPSEEVVERLWEMSAPWALACAVRLGLAAGELSERLGGTWAEGRLIDSVQQNPADTIVRLLGRSVPELRRAIALTCPRPARPCDPEALLRACFDWLIAESAGRFSCREWVRRHPSLLDDESSRSFCNRHWGAIDLIRRVPEEARDAARFPRMVTAAAWHAVRSNAGPAPDISALVEICADVSSLVGWALIAALVDDTIATLGGDT